MWNFYLKILKIQPLTSHCPWTLKKKCSPRGQDNSRLVYLKSKNQKFLVITCKKLVLGRRKKKMKFEFLAELWTKNPIFRSNFCHFVPRKISCNKNNKKSFVQIRDNVILKKCAKFEGDRFITFREIVTTDFKNWVSRKTRAKVYLRRDKLR